MVLYFLQPSFQILKEPLLVKKQTIPQLKALDLSFFNTLKVGVAAAGGRHTLLLRKAYFAEFYGAVDGF